MEPKCVLDFMRGYGTMIVRVFNGGMDIHCSRMRQAAGPGLRREPIQKMKRAGIDEDPLCS